MGVRAFTTAAFAAAAIAFASAPAFAGSLPATAGDASVAALNAHLATLVVTAQAQAQPQSRAAARASKGAPGARFANVAHARPVHLAPFLLELAGRYDRAERLLHYRSHGFDANLWGAVGGGRVKFSYGVKF